MGVNDIIHFDFMDPPPVQVQSVKDGEVGYKQIVGAGVSFSCFSTPQPPLPASPPARSPNVTSHP